MVRNKPVALALEAEIARRAVPWHEHRLVAQRPELLRDQIDQILMVATRKSVRPIEPWNSTSPTIASFDGA